MDISDDLLVHQISIETLTAHTYAPPAVVACFVVDATPPDGLGVVIAHPDDVDRFTLDSRITLPSGHTVYVAAILRHDDGGLGAPSHLEIRLAAGRTADTLPDTARLSRPGEPTFDPGTGELTPTGSAYWSGPARVEAITSAGAAIDTGEQPVGIQEFLVTVPLSAVDIRRGDQLQILTSDDPRLPTRTLVVLKVEAGTDTTTRRFRALDNQGAN